jgi:hypothetical protein
MSDEATSSTTPPLDIYDALSQRHKPSTDRFEATQFPSEQKQLWRTLLSDLRQSTSDPAIAAFCDRLSSSVANEANIFQETYSDSGEQKYLIGTIPILNADVVNRLRSMLSNQWQQYSIAAAIFYECQSLTRDFLQSMSAPFLVAVLRYMTGGILPKDIGWKVKSAMEAIEQASARSLQSSEASQQFVLASKRELNVFLVEKTADFDAFKRSLAESLKLQAATSLWNRKARVHRIFYLAWFFIFVSIAGSALWYTLTHYDSILSMLPRDKDNGISYASLIFFLVPVIGVAWLLRIISRFITIQHALADDAELRDVMTKTYLALVSNKDSQVDEKDRIIMLTAIFRPLPGSQLEEVAPPTVIDFLKRQA